MSEHIHVQGAWEHNLQGVDLSLPRDSLVVVTGLSGSGKSSLAFDTIHQEGQRRFLESLSSYARQFLGKMDKPRVDRVDGLSPTVAIDQKTVNRNPRSTVGTVTEILDHLRLLMARLGTPRCPECGTPIETSSPGQIADTLLRDAPEARLHVLAPIVQHRKGEYRKELARALADGFVRARIDGELHSLEDDLQLARYEQHTIELVVDRLRARLPDRPRLVESIERALALAGAQVSFLIDVDGEATHRSFSSARSCPVHGISIPEVEPRLFSFNAPQGMCPTCAGIGWLEDFELDLLFDDAAPLDRALRPLQQDERLPFSSLSRQVLRTIARALGLDPRTPWRDLEDRDRDALLHGAPVEYTVIRERDGQRVEKRKTWAGIMATVRYVWSFTHLKRLAPYRRRVRCPACEGARLNPIARAVRFRGAGITDLTGRTVAEAATFFRQVRLRPAERPIGAGILREIRTRLDFLLNIGLGYLSLDRSAATLSGGEAQRIRLASQIGAALQGVTYVLDEPSIGLHGRDQGRLLDALVALRDKGNTVIVVEHDPATMMRADYLVEVGPGAGREGGRIVAHGRPRRFLRSRALTARYLRGDLHIPMPTRRRTAEAPALVLRGARANNLRDVTLRLPLGCLTVVTGVSGSGKSTLIEQTLYRALAARLHGALDTPGEHESIDGVEHIDKVVEISQAPIGRTPRSNPATYTGMFTPIRELFAQLPEARARGYGKGRFSFNVRGGRCEECQGAGVKTVEMQFLADVQVPCEVCSGRRFNEETLQVRYRGRTITDVLEMRVHEALEFFRNHRRVRRILQTLDDVGMGYVALGQPSTTLSGGEAQRIKLATELARPATGRTLYILDEPTTGLHMADVGRLIAALQRLVDAGNTVVVIEHNTDIIKVADHLVDLGPDGGEAGGRVVGQGTPEQLSTLDTPTGAVLAEALAWEARAEQGMAAEPPARWRRRRRRRAPMIELRGVQTHNLAHVDLDLPQGQMTVVTGPSGSGKTSLAFDTIFAEGQRRYVESLSTYARRFLGRMGPAPLDRADGLAPAIAIDQRNRGHNPRSTVATVTEIQDAMRLLYARIGRPHCPTCGRALMARSPGLAARHLAALAPGAGTLLAQVDPGRHVADLLREGFTRGWDGEARDLDALPDDATMGGMALVIDRLDPARVSLARLSESIAVAYGYGADRARFVPRRGALPISLSRHAECPEHGAVITQGLTPRHFSFNHHLGACPACDGLGRRVEVDPDLILPRPADPLARALDGRVAAVMNRTPRNMALLAALFDAHGTPMEAPVREWSPALRHAVLNGSTEELSVSWERRWGRSHTTVTERRRWGGLVPLVSGWAKGAATFSAERPCSVCQGGRLRPELLAVTIGGAMACPEGGETAGEGLGMAQATALTVDQSITFWSGISLCREQRTIAAQPVADLLARLRFLSDVGLGYLTLDRGAATLSGGEAQRIRLATQLGARLTGTIYVLDEPTVGLHPRDTARLLHTLADLRDLGNTLIVVEHDPEVMRAADHLVDLGPGAGALGGQIVAQDSPARLAQGEGLTAQYLSGRRAISHPAQRRRAKKWLRPPAAQVHNLQGIRPPVPRGLFTVVTGVSGSGKSSFVLDHVRTWLEARVKARDQRLPRRVVVVDQRRGSASARSTTATFTDVLGPIRELFAQTPQARARGWTAGRFSYNSPKGGRCPHCEGRGQVTVEMHFLPDVQVPCEHCGGRRFGKETLEIRWKSHTIADVLDLDASAAHALFRNQRRIASRLANLEAVGLGYLRLGQPLNTLSGGELQRLRLARELVGRPNETVYLLDEPTTGLHFTDVERLLAVLHRLVDAGHTVVVIEHHLDVITNADHVIDLGPEGGDGGGQVVATGTPEEVAASAGWTGQALRRIL